MPRPRLPVSNLRLASTKPDPIGVDKLIVKVEEQVVGVLKHAQEKMNEVVTGKQVKLPEMVQLEQVDLDMDNVRREMDRITSNLSSQMAAMMRQGIQHAYRSGKNYAQRQVARMQRETGGASPRLTRQDRELIKLLHNMDLSLVKSLSARHTNEATAIIAQGLVDGLSQAEIVEQMVARLPTTSFQARRIVRTEIIRAASNGSKKQYLDSRLTYWQWQTCRKRSVKGGTEGDERVCPICRPLHGKIVKIGEPFNQYLSYQGRQLFKDKFLYQPPAHPNCRCAMAPAAAPEFTKRAPAPSPAAVPVKVIRPKLVGFTNWESQEIQQLTRTIPNDVKRQVKALRGENSIRKTAGRIMDDLEVQSLLPQAIQNQFRKATGIYVGAKLNQIFVDNTAGNDEVFHEVGHAVFDEYLKPKRAMRGWEQIHEVHAQTGDFVTARAHISTREHFADAFRYYLLNPASLRYRYPEVYDFLKKEVFLYNERDNIITLENGFKVLTSRGKWVEYIDGKNRLPHHI